MLRSIFVPIGLTSLGLLAGCSVGPDYVAPAVPETPAYKGSMGNWKKAEPRDTVARGNWYSVFHDPQLNRLEAQAQVNNQNLRAAVARVSEARAVAREAEANFYPTLDFSASGDRESTSPNNGAQVAQTTASGVPSNRYTYNTATVVPFDLSYEVDIWGRVRREFEANADQAQATLADLENVLLSLRADVATNYFALRALDSEIQVQRDTIKAYQQNLDLTNSRFQGGISTQLDVEQAKATLASAQAQLASFQQNRDEFEHAIAVDEGLPPASFSIPFSPLTSTPPSIPPGLPSDLLERRPDVAAAERRVAAQNAEIGVAIAAYFPVVRLTGSTGLDSGDLGLLFNWESRIWSIGPSIQFPIFEGGQIAANVKQQRAAYEENVATYRQDVLVAFQDVEDSLSSIRYLAQQYEAENRAYQSYQKALDLTNARYSSGLVSYFDVIQAQNLALAAQQQTVQIAGNRMAATVRLIKAIGGGWGDSRLTRPDFGDHVDQPSAKPTVLGPLANQTVPQTSPSGAH
jgi:NodT family efflux transporter outer membrane factor (OMF) lipoprotein